MLKILNKSLTVIVVILIVSCTNIRKPQTILPNNFKSSLLHTKVPMYDEAAFFPSPDGQYVLVRYFHLPSGSMGSGNIVLGLYENDTLVVEQVYPESLIQSQLKWKDNNTIECFVDINDSIDVKQAISYNKNKPTKKLTDKITLSFLYFNWLDIISKKYNEKFQTNTTQADFKYNMFWADSTSDTLSGFSYYMSKSNNKIILNFNYNGIGDVKITFEGIEIYKGSLYDVNK